MAAPKVLQTFEFVDDRKAAQQWPDEWFNGQILVLTPEHLRVVDPLSKQGKKQMAMRRQSIKEAAQRKGLAIRINRHPKQVALVIQVTGKLPSAAAPAAKKAGGK